MPFCTAVLKVQCFGCCGYNWCCSEGCLLALCCFKCFRCTRCCCKGCCCACSGCFKRMHVAGVAMGHICVDVTVGELPVEVVAVPFWSSTKLINLWSFSTWSASGSTLSWPLHWEHRLHRKKNNKITSQNWMKSLFVLLVKITVSHSMALLGPHFLLSMTTNYADSRKHFWELEDS